MTTNIIRLSGLAALLGGVLLIILDVAGSVSRLSQPRDPAFLSVVLFLVLALVATTAAIWETVRKKAK